MAEGTYLKAVFNISDYYHPIDENSFKIEGMTLAKDERFTYEVKSASFSIQ